MFSLPGIPLIIVGGGPAGCSCALYTSRADLKTVILDKNPAVGALTITHKIANYPGVPEDISGEALLEIMREQAITFGTDYRRGLVFGIDVSGDRKTVYTPEGTFKGRALVLATGAMGRTASFKGEAEFLGRGVSYCATCDGAFYRDHDVAVIGANQEAIEEAQVLTKFASTVHLVTFKDPPAEDPHVQDLLALSNVKHWSRSRLLKIEGDEMGVTGIQVKPKEAKTPVNLPKWRQRVGVEGVEHLLKQVIRTVIEQQALKPSELAKVNVDTTVQEKEVAFPTDARLYDKARRALVRTARKHQLRLRQSYVRLGKRALFWQSRYAAARPGKRAQQQTRKLRTYLGRVIRDVERQATPRPQNLQALLGLAKRIHHQQRQDKGKLYSIRAPETECITKGKTHKRYEFRYKVVLATTHQSNWKVIG